MKYLKTFENKYENIRNRANYARELFIDIWDNKLLLIKPIIALNTDLSGIILRCHINAETNNKTYKYFKKLFDMLEKLNYSFSYDRGNFSVFIEDVEKFIKEMELIKNTEKYNL